MVVDGSNTPELVVSEEDLVKKRQEFLDTSRQKLTQIAETVTDPHLRQKAEIAFSLHTSLETKKNSETDTGITISTISRLIDVVESTGITDQTVTATALDEVLTDFNLGDEVILQTLEYQLKREAARHSFQTGRQEVNGHRLDAFLSLLLYLSQKNSPLTPLANQLLVIYWGSNRNFLFSRPEMGFKIGYHLTEAGNLSRDDLKYFVWYSHIRDVDQKVDIPYRAILACDYDNEGRLVLPETFWMVFVQASGKTTDAYSFFNSLQESKDIIVENAENAWVWLRINYYFGSCLDNGC